MKFAPYLILSLSGMMLLAGLAPLPAAPHEDARTAPAVAVPVASVAFLIVGYLYKPRDYMQEETAKWPASPGQEP